VQLRPYGDEAEGVRGLGRSGLGRTTCRRKTTSPRCLHQPACDHRPMMPWPSVTDSWP